MKVDSNILVQKSLRIRQLLIHICELSQGIKTIGTLLLIKFKQLDISMKVDKNKGV